MKQYQNVQRSSISPWALLPLRLFLGITFIYAGLQKLLDPQFFNPTASGYIGKQVAGFAQSSPLHDFLLRVVVPHATLFGGIVAYGEVAIGVGALCGLFVRPAAFCGLLLSILFWLSATWHVYPYFYGSDIVFAFCWLTLLLNGPLNTGLPTLDELLTLRLLQNGRERAKNELVHTLFVMLGTAGLYEQASVTASNAMTQRLASHGRQNTRGRAKGTRRTFLHGALTGGVSVFVFGSLLYALRALAGTANNESLRSGSTPSGRSGDDGSSRTGDDDDSGRQSSQGAQTPSQSGSATASGSKIAMVSAVPVNSATSFTIPSTGDPGILVHLNNGQFVAYNALCTHAGCVVDYDAASQLLTCPCHSAAFDPARDAAVVQPPAQSPLPSVAVHVDSATGAIMLGR